MSALTWLTVGVVGTLVLQLAAVGTATVVGWVREHRRSQRRMQEMEAVIAAEKARLLRTDNGVPPAAPTPTDPDRDSTHARFALLPWRWMN